MHGDRADPLRARRLHVVDAVGAGDDALERRRDEPAHEVRVRADVDRRDPHDRDVAARVLPDAERADRLQPGDQDDQVDDDREDRPLDEEIGEPHQLSSWLGRRIVAGLHLVVDENGRAVAQLEDARGHDLVARLDARDDRDLIAARAPELDELLAHAAVGLTVRVLEIGHDEDRIAVRRVADGGRRQRDDRAAGAQRSAPSGRTCPGRSVPSGLASVACT